MNAQKYSDIRRLILFQNIFCINRLHWTELKTYKIFGSIVFYICLATVVGLNIYEIITYVMDPTKVYNVLIPKMFAYSLQALLLTELLPLAITAKQSTNIRNKLVLFEEKCEFETIRNVQIEEDHANDDDDNFNKNRTMIILNLLFSIIDLVAMYVLEYPTSVVVTLTVAFGAHCTELLFYSLIVMEFNAKLATLVQINAAMGTKIYRHVVIAATNYSLDSNITQTIMMLMASTLTIIYFGAAIIIEEPRTQTVLLGYFLWCEVKYTFCLWFMCYASYQFQVLSNQLINRLSVRLVFSINSNDNSSRKLTKTWIRCVKSIQTRCSVENNSFSINLALPLKLLDYTSNFILIIMQVHIITQYYKSGIAGTTSQPQE